RPARRRADLLRAREQGVGPGRSRLRGGLGDSRRAGPHHPPPLRPPPHPHRVAAPRAVRTAAATGEPPLIELRGCSFQYRAQPDRGGEPREVRSAAATGGPPLVELRGWSFQYRAHALPTLRDIGLAVRRGEEVTIGGASGAGMSTLLRVLNVMIPHHHRGTVT